MKIKKITTLSVLSLSLLSLAGCANNGYSNSGWNSNSSNVQTQQTVRYGSIVSVEHFSEEDGGTSVGGLILGALAGGIIGNQIGSGSGRTIATVAGAGLGSYAGNEIGSKPKTTTSMVRLTIREEGGSQYVITQRAKYQFYQGQKVQVIYNGPNSAEVVPMK